jgi:hypothetical protein
MVDFKRLVVIMEEMKARMNINREKIEVVREVMEAIREEMKAWLKRWRPRWRHIWKNWRPIKKRRRPQQSTITWYHA